MNGVRTMRNSSSFVVDKPQNISQLGKNEVGLVTSVNGLSVSETSKTGKRNRSKKKKRCKIAGDCCEDNGLGSGAGPPDSCITVGQVVPPEIDLQVSEAKNGNGTKKTSSLPNLMEPKNMSQLSKVEDALLHSANGVLLAESPKRVKRRRDRRRKNCIPTITDCGRDDSLEPGGGHLISHVTIPPEVPQNGDLQVFEAKTGDQTSRRSSTSIEFVEELRNILWLRKDEGTLVASVDGDLIAKSPEGVKRRRVRTRKKCSSEGDCCEDDGLKSGSESLVSLQNIHPGFPLKAGSQVPVAESRDQMVTKSSSSYLMEGPDNISLLSKDDDALARPVNGVPIAASPKRVKRRHGHRRKNSRSASDFLRDHSLESGAEHVSHEIVQQDSSLDATLQVSEANHDDQMMRKLSSLGDEEPKNISGLNKEEALIPSVNGVSVAESLKRVKRRRDRRKKNCTSSGDCCEANHDDQIMRKFSSLDDKEPKNMSGLNKKEALIPSVNGVLVAESSKRVKRRRDRRKKICTSAGDRCETECLGSGASPLVSYEALQQQSSLEAQGQVSEGKNGDSLIQKSSSDLLAGSKTMSCLSKNEHGLMASDNCVLVTESSESVNRSHSKKRKGCGSAGDCCGPSVDDSLEDSADCLVSDEIIRRQFSQEGIQAEVSVKKSLPGELSGLPSLSTGNVFQEFLSYIPQKSLVICSRKKLLILDVNGLLADIVRPAPKWCRADTRIRGRAVFIRPFCFDFLDFCLERFDVAIWSSRSKKMLDIIVQFLLGDLKEKLVFCWDLSQCTQSKVNTLENRHKPIVFKELRKIWEKTDPHVPWEKGYYNAKNTLLVDDSPYKALLNPPNTALFPVSYSFKDRHVDNSIGPGGNIRTYLEELAQADNVQEYIKSHPVGQSAITEESLTWPFYEKAIKKQRVV